MLCRKVHQSAPARPLAMLGHNHDLIERLFITQVSEKFLVKREVYFTTGSGCLINPYLTVFYAARETRAHSRAMEEPEQMCSLSAAE